jgi:hypothetical membrane protein
VVQPLFVLTELLALAAFVGPYSLVDNTISDLGATACTDIAYPRGPVPVCSPWHALVNAGFVASGLLLVVGALAARRLLPRRRLSNVAVVGWAVGGLSSVATGLVPLDRDLELHVLVSSPVFLAQPVATLLTGRLVRETHPRLGRAAVVLGLIGLAAGLLVFAWLEAPALGLLERVALWPGYVLPCLLALALRRRPDR